MKPILFEKNETTFTGLGICHISDAISCTVTEERNGGFELELVYPVSGAFFDEIQEDRIIVAKARENGTRQAFRIYRITTQISGEVTVNARHISYQLNFIPVDPVSGSGTAQAMMNALKGAALEACPFSFQSDIAGSKAYEFTTPVALRTSLGGMEGSVLDLFGGEFEWDNWTVKLLSARGSDKGAKIAYGKNLTALERSTDIGTVITGVAAYYAGQDENGADVIVYSSPKVITNGNVSDYAHGRTIVLDVSGEFDTVPTQAQVTTYAQAYLAATTLAQVTEALSVDFIPLWHTKEYSDIFQEHIDLCDTVTIVYKKLGISVKKKVTKTVFNVLLNRYDTIELGGEADVAETIAGLDSSSDETARQLAQLASAVELLKGKIINAPLPVANGGTGASSVGDAYKIASTTITDTASKAAGATYNISKTADAVSGYTPICVCGWGSTGMTYLSIANFYMDSSNVIHISGRNLGPSAVTPSFSVRVLYAKTT